MNDTWIALIGTVAALAIGFLATWRTLRKEIRDGQARSIEHTDGKIQDVADRLDRMDGRLDRMDSRFQNFMTQTREDFREITGYLLGKAKPSAMHPDPDGSP